VTLVRWNPFGEMMSLRQAVDRLLEESFIPPRGIAGDLEQGSMEIDVLERNDAYVIRASLPGVKPEDISVTMERGMLTLRGEARQEQEQGEGRYHRRERRFSSYARSISLPSEVNADACDASYEHGVLTITLPKAEQAKAKQIAVRGQSTHGAEKPAIEGERVSTRPASSERDAGTGTTNR
jgi:HSP20 family protein